MRLNPRMPQQQGPAMTTQRPAMMGGPGPMRGSGQGGLGAAMGPRMQPVSMDQSQAQMNQGNMAPRVSLPQGAGMEYNPGQRQNAAERLQPMPTPQLANRNFQSGPVPQAQPAPPTLQGDALLGGGGPEQGPMPSSEPPMQRSPQYRQLMSRALQNRGPLSSF